MSVTKIVDQTLLFATRKPDWFADRLSALTASNDSPKTFASLAAMSNSSHFFT